MSMRKYEIALLLATRFGYTSYLEICSPLTGGTFSQVDRQQFSRRVRVMYRCPSDFSDGETIDFSTEEASGEQLFGDILRSGERFDIVFIDSFHTYVESLRDIVYALQLVQSDGLILIHDCYPPDATFASAERVLGGWCGLTFAAYLDVVLFRKDLHHVTVDSDYGCGMISRDNRLAHLSDFRPDPDLISQWSAQDLPHKYSFFEKHHSQLLNLISPEVFRERLFDPCLPGTLERTRHELEIMERDLSDSRNALEEAQNQRAMIENTVTWKMRQRFHHIPFLSRLYRSVISALRALLRPAKPDQ